MLPYMLLATLATCAYGAAIENCHMERLVKCGDPLSAFRKEMGQSFPTSEDQVKHFCESMKQAKECAEEFQTKCMTPMQIQTMEFLMQGSLNVYDDFCSEGSVLKADYLKHADCIDETTKTDEAKGYYSYVEAALENLKDLEPSKKLPTTCCGYHWLNTKFNKMGSEKCGQEAIDSFQKVVTMAVSSLPNVLCSGFDSESKQCTDLLPPVGSKPKGTIRDSHIAKTFTSLYLHD